MNRNVFVVMLISLIIFTLSPIFALLFDKPVPLLQNLQTQDTNTVAVHPSGKWIVSGHDDGTIQIRESASGFLLYNIPFSIRQVTRVIFDSTGNFFAVSDGDLLRVYDFSNLEPVLNIKESVPINWFDFAPDRPAVVIAYGPRGKMAVCPLPGQSAATIRTEYDYGPEPVKRFQISADGIKLALQLGENKIHFPAFDDTAFPWQDIILTDSDKKLGPWQVDFRQSRILLSFSGFDSGFMEWRDGLNGRVLSRSDSCQIGTYGKISDCRIGLDGKTAIITASGGCDSSYLAWISGKVFIWDGKKVSEGDSGNNGVRAAVEIPKTGRIIVCGGHNLNDGTKPPSESLKLSCWQISDLLTPGEARKSGPIWTVTNAGGGPRGSFVFAPVPGSGRHVYFLLRAGAWFQNSTLRVWDLEEGTILAVKNFTGRTIVIPDYETGVLLCMADVGDPDSDGAYELTTLNPLTLEPLPEKDAPYYLEPQTWDLVNKKTKARQTCGALLLKTQATYWQENWSSEKLIFKGNKAGGITISGVSETTQVWRLLFPPWSDNKGWILFGPKGFFDLSSPELLSEIRFTLGMQSFPAEQFAQQYYQSGLFQKIYQDGLENPILGKFILFRPDLVVRVKAETDKNPALCRY